MASEKIDALELDINAKLTTENLDKLITSLGKLSKALDNVNAKKVKDDIKGTGDASKEAAAKADILTNSFVNQAVKITALIGIFRKLSDVISSGVSESMSYVENLNLFTVSLGEYADSASKYAQTVRDALGIDYSEWQRTEGVFNTLIEGFGVTGDKAAYMSQNLTQLTYDIASFYNLSFSEAEKKLQSAVAGELEPVRRIGYDLSQAKLTAIAQNPEYYGRTTYAINEETGALIGNTEALGENIDRQIANFNELTQAEKVQLRYIALMTQIQEVQGDMARTLNDPANQMRIFKEQLTMTSRALGNAFIPLLNQTLPYLTAFFNILEEGLQKIAAWFGYEIPDMSDRMDISDTEPYYENIVEATGKAAKNAKKIKDYTIGLDELNVLRPDDNTSTGGSGSPTNYGNLATDLITPGYDFITSAIENRVKDAKAALEQFGKDLKEHPFDTIGGIGQGFWEWVLGKTPEELAEEAAANGNTVGEQFVIAYSTAIQNSPFGLGSEGIIEWLTGKTSDELAQDAWDSGQSVRTAFITSLATNSLPAKSLGKGVSAWETVLGLDENLEDRAQKAGRTVGEQFAIECGKALAKLGTQNPFFAWLYEVSTGRSAQDDLAAFERATYKGNTTDSPYDVRNTLGINGSAPWINHTEYQRDNAATIEAAKHGKQVANAYTNSVAKTYKATDNAAVIEARKHGEATAKAYAEGVAKSQDTLKETGNGVYNTIWNGAYHNGQAFTTFYNDSSTMAKRYNDGLKTGVSGAKSAGNSLYSSGYNGATNYGRAVADYYNVSSNASSSYARGLVNGTTSVANAGNSLYFYGYNGAANYGNGGNEYYSLADKFANLFSGGLGSNSALSGSYNSGYKLANEGTWGAYDLNSEFEYIGDMAGQGYILGIRKNEYKAEYAGDTVASATLYRMKEVLGIASPSKEGYEMGMYLDLGFANAIRDFTSKATDASENVARMSVLAMKTSSSMFNSGISVPTTTNAGYGMGVMNEGAMASLASNIYQAVVSGMSVASNGTGGDIKVIIDGKEVFKVVQKEQRDRGVAISNGAFSR